jgi:hypothetical protein
VLFNEAMGTELFRASGLPVPEWRVLKAPDMFLRDAESLWGARYAKRPTPGPAFGSRFLWMPGRRSYDYMPDELLPRVRNKKDFWLAWLLDQCGRNMDNRQAIYLERPQGDFKAVFVDHGHLFGGPKDDNKSVRMGLHYFNPRVLRGVSSREISALPNKLKVLDFDRLWARANTLPAEWKNAQALESFARCLDNLARPRFLEALVQLMIQEVPPTSRYVPRPLPERSAIAGKILPPELPPQHAADRVVAG